MLSQIVNANNVLGQLDFRELGILWYNFSSPNCCKKRREIIVDSDKLNNQPTKESKKSSFFLIGFFSYWFVFCWMKNTSLVSTISV